MSFFANVRRTLHQFPIQLKKNPKAVCLLSLLPVLSLSLSLYADRITFSTPAEPSDFVSPLSSRNFAWPGKLAGAATASAELNEVAQSSPTAQSSISAEKAQTADVRAEPTATTKPAVVASPKAVSVTAKTSRINFPNNKFGVHIFANEEDLSLAAELVNSHGGDWGWVTLTIDLAERNGEKWNNLFAKMLDRHLLPILQLSANGRIPSEAEIDGLAAFLGGLGWPIRIRPVTVFSEVNASEYWGGKIDPEGYARILNRAVDSFKGQSPEFFIMNGAFNASARTGSAEIGCIKTDLGVDTCYLSEIEFLKRMEAAVPGILKKLDGWAVHTYPHPAYRGRPSDTKVGAESAFEAGRNTIRSYQFELRLLSTFGVSLPIFITETGWPHREGKTDHPEWYDQNTVAEFYRAAFRDIFLPDARVVAVTAFVLRFDNYDNFAFVAADGHKFPQWETLVNFAKVAGSPPANR